MLNKQMVTMGIMFLGGRFVQDPQTVQLLMGLYLLVAIYYWQTMTGLEALVKQDDTPIWIPVEQPKGIMDAFLGGPELPPKEYTKTTMREHELKLAATKGNGAFMSALQPFLMAQFMGMNVLLLLRVVTMPWDMLEDPMIQKYVMGQSVDRGYKELYADPAAHRGSAASAIEGAGGAVNGTAPGVGGRDVDFEEAIFRTWESADPVEIGIFEHLITKAGKDANYGTMDQGWTALQVVAGSPQNGRREVVRLLELGCRAEQCDAEGWTALHWAAFHGNASAARVILAGYGLDMEPPAKGARAKVPTCGDATRAAALLRLHDSRGRSAEDVARGTGAAGAAGAAVLEVLVKAMAEAGAKAAAAEAAATSAPVRKVAIRKVPLSKAEVKSLLTRSESDTAEEPEEEPEEGGVVDEQ